MKSTDIASMFRWGEGRVFTVVIFTLVSLVLLSNVTALILSVPEIVSEVPREHTSKLNGSMELPYLISGIDDISITVPEMVNISEPFSVTARYHKDRYPAMNPHMEFHFGEESIYYLMGTTEDRGVRVSSVYMPGLPADGNWTYRIVQFMDGPGTDELGSFSPEDDTLTVVDPGEPRYHPVLGDDLSCGSTLILMGSMMWNGSNNGIDVRIDLSMMQPTMDGSNMKLNISDLRPGWHSLDLIYEATSNLTEPEEFTYLFYRRGESGIQSPIITAKRVFDGFDEAYDQEPEGNVSFRWDSGELYAGDLYRIDVQYLLDPRGDLEIIGSEMEVQIPAPILTVGIDDRIYPLSYDPEVRAYYGFLTTPTEIDDAIRLIISSEKWSGTSKGRSIDIDLKVDRTPDITLEPDPWLKVNLGRTDNLIVNISAGPFQLGYRDIETQPDLIVSGIQYNMSDDRTEFWPIWSSVINMSGESDHDDIIIGLVASFVYYEFPLLVLPWPPFVFGFPPVMYGSEAVLWFFLMFSAIMISAGALISSSILKDPGWRSDGSRFTSPVRFDSGISITYRVYMAIIFFSLSVVFLFNIMDQSTPTPEFLTTAVPIWARMMSLAEASVWEEVIVRFLMIGIPLFIIKSLSKGDNGSVGEALSKKGWQFRELIGGRNVFGRSEIGLIILSSSLFGLAHIGWGPWKVVPTLVSGLLFGYLFIRVGLHATIIVHFLIDYASFLNEITGSGSWILYVVYYISLLIGGLFIAMILVEAVQWMASRFGRDRVPGWIYLAAHSSVSVIFGIYAIIRGDVLISIIFLQVPFMSLLAFILDRMGLKLAPRFIVFCFSLLTLALAPLGMAWIIDSVRSDRDKGAT